MALTIDSIMEVINSLPHSPTRVPYTYHHDYLRENCSVFAFSSRAEIAEKHKTTNLELYILALAQIINTAKAWDVLDFTPEQIEVCKKVKVEAYKIIKKYKPIYTSNQIL